MDRREYLLSLLVALNDGVPNKEVRKDFYRKANIDYKRPKKVVLLGENVIVHADNMPEIVRRNDDDGIIGFGKKTLKNYGKNAVIVEGGWVGEDNISLVQKNEISERSAYLNEMSTFFGDEINKVSEGEFTIFIEHNT